MTVRLVCPLFAGGFNQSNLTRPGGQLGSGDTSRDKTQRGTTFDSNTVLLSSIKYNIFSALRPFDDPHKIFTNTSVSN